MRFVLRRCDEGVCRLLPRPRGATQDLFFLAAVSPASKGRVFRREPLVLGRTPPSKELNANVPSVGETRSTAREVEPIAGGVASFGCGVASRSGSGRIHPFELTADAVTAFTQRRLALCFDGEQVHV